MWSIMGTKNSPGGLIVVFHLQSIARFHINTGNYIHMSYYREIIKRCQHLTFFISMKCGKKNKRRDFLKKMAAFPYNKHTAEIQMNICSSLGNNINSYQEDLYQLHTIIIHDVSHLGILLRGIFIFTLEKVLILNWLYSTYGI